MTSLFMRGAGVAVLIEGIWALHVALTDFLTVSVVCPAGGCPGGAVEGFLGDAILLLGILTVLDGVVGVWGARFAYWGGCALSVALLVVMVDVAWLDSPYSYLSSTLHDAEIGAAVAVVALLLNVAAVKGRGGLSEQAHPMNLPVFG